jgi:hypothetical protein
MDEKSIFGQGAQFFPPSFAARIALAMFSEAIAEQSKPIK